MPKRFINFYNHITIQISQSHIVLRCIGSIYLLEEIESFLWQLVDVLCFSGWPHTHTYIHISVAVMKFNEYIYEKTRLGWVLIEKYVGAGVRNRTIAMIIFHFILI